MPPNEEEDWDSEALKLWDSDACVVSPENELHAEQTMCWGRPPDRDDMECELDEDHTADYGQPLWLCSATA